MAIRPMVRMVEEKGRCRSRGGSAGCFGMDLKGEWLVLREESARFAARKPRPIMRLFIRVRQRWRVGCVG